MRIPNETIEEIRDALRMEEVVGEYVTLTRKGSRYMGLCPFHQEKTPSFSVNPDEKLFYCFGCQKGGNIFKFIQEIENCSFHESVEILGKKAGISIQASDAPVNSEKKQKTELYNRVAKSFHHILLHKEEAEQARRYLDSRGVSAEVIEHFLLGWAPGNPYWLHHFLSSKGFSYDFLSRSALFSAKNPTSSLFRGRIMFPITNPQGEVIAFGGRTMGDGQPKYINSPESDMFRKRDNLYGLHVARESIRREKSVIVVEGYTDVIALAQEGFLNTVAPLGTAFTEKQASILKRYAERLIIMFDGDRAGIEAALKGVRLCEKQGISSWVVVLPDSSDPAEFLHQYGKNELHNMIKKSINSFEFYINTVMSRYPSHTPADKEKAVYEMYGFVDDVGSDIKREEYLKLIAERFDLHIETVVKNYRQRHKTGYTPSIPEKHDQYRFLVDTELYLLIAVSVNHQYFNQVRNSLKIDDFQNSYARDLFIILEEEYRTDSMSTENILAKVASEELKNRILHALSTDEFGQCTEKVIEESIRTIKIKSIESRRDKIQKLIRKAEKENTPSVEMIQLLEEKMYIDSELEKLKVGGND